MLLFHYCVGVILIVLSQKSAAAAIGTSCSKDIDCELEHSECSNHVCTCRAGFLAASDMCVEGTGTGVNRMRLYNDLLAQYNKDVTPGGSNGGPLVIHHSLNMQRVIALEHNILTLQVWEDFRWNDPRLRWDREEYNISILHLPSKHIWQPDVLLSNSAEDYTGFASGDVVANVNDDGQVIFIPPKITKSICHFDDSILYANNEVNCSLKYMSWTRDANNIDLQINYPSALEHNTNPNWNVVANTAVRHVTTYACCPNSPYVDVEYKLTLKRIK